jgi:hypothetical protein
VVLMGGVTLGGGGRIAKRARGENRGLLKRRNRTVEAMCKANWPAHKRPTEAGWDTLERAAARGLEGSLLARPPRRQRGPGPESRARV